MTESSVFFVALWLGLSSYAVVELLIFSHDVSSVSKSRLLFQFKSNTANECNDEQRPSRGPGGYIGEGGRPGV